MASHGPHVHQKSLGNPYLDLLAAIFRGQPDELKRLAYRFFRPEVTAFYAKRREHAGQA